MSQVQLPLPTKPQQIMPAISQTVGTTLRMHRLAKEIPLEEISRQTFIKQNYLQALEDGDFALLPAPVYTAGYIRQYAKVLGLDGNQLVQQYQQESQNHQNELPLGPSLPQTPPVFEEEDPILLKASAFTPVFSQVNGRMKLKEISLPQVAPEVQANLGEKKMKEPAPGVPKLPLIVSSDNRVVETIEGARKEALIMKHQAEQYADRVLNQLEQDIQHTLQVLKNGRAHLKQRLTAYEQKSAL